MPRMLSFVKMGAFPRNLSESAICLGALLSLALGTSEALSNQVDALTAALAEKPGKTGIVLHISDYGNAGKNFDDLYKAVAKADQNKTTQIVFVFRGEYFAFTDVDPYSDREINTRRRDTFEPVDPSGKDTMFTQWTKEVPKKIESYSTEAGGYGACKFLLDQNVSKIIYVSSFTDPGQPDAAQVLQALCKAKSASFYAISTPENMSKDRKRDIPTKPMQAIFDLAAATGGKVCLPEADTLQDQPLLGSDKDKEIRTVEALNTKKVVEVAPKLALFSGKEPKIKGNLLEWEEDLVLLKDPSMDWETDLRALKNGDPVRFRDGTAKFGLYVPQGTTQAEGVVIFLSSISPKDSLLSKLEDPEWQKFAGEKSLVLLAVEGSFQDARNYPIRYGLDQFILENLQKGLTAAGNIAYRPYFMFYGGENVNMTLVRIFQSNTFTPQNTLATVYTDSLVDGFINAQSLQIPTLIVADSNANVEGTNIQIQFTEGLLRKAPWTFVPAKRGEMPNGVDAFIQNYFVAMKKLRTQPDSDSFISPEGIWVDANDETTDGLPVNFLPQESLFRELWKALKQAR